MKKSLSAVVFACCCFLISTVFAAEKMPSDFTDLKKINPTVIYDIRYFTLHNFVGAKVDGYNAPKCILTKQAANALTKVQEELLPFGLSLKIYDCYRPKSAVAHFVRWAEEIDNTLTKEEFYPDVDKKNLFKDGYIAHKSGHSRGSTVDLTIVALPNQKQEKYIPHKNLRRCDLQASERFGDSSIDMGSGFDCFSPVSATEYKNISPQQRSNRALLKSIMTKHGFKNYDLEWWHYTLENEPYPDKYFGFSVK